MGVEPFAIPYSQAAVDDLRSRLARTRWPDPAAGSGWEYGAALAFVREICRYWQDQFDWKAQIARISAFHHYRYTADGFGIHFIHERGKGPAPLPLVLTHGWPGSFLEMLKIIPLLTDPAGHGGDPADSFDVVVPSLPGYGFSDRPQTPSMNSFRIAELWTHLMHDLGYRRFGAQGGDIGASVTTVLGLRHAECITGIHLNYIPGSYRPFLQAEPTLAPVEIAFSADAERWYSESGGYAHLQRTTPLTAAYGLNDSPAGLAAWILEKFHDWSDCSGDLERRFTKDELLSNVTLYWMTETIHSSFRWYYETRLAPLQFKEGERVGVPCAIARFPKEAPFPPREWIERGYNIQRWTEMPRGGHFAAAEEPELLAEDMRAFFRGLR
ncbi:MAG: epoxide hydrolase [Acidobacteriia bacterium]|nr:epoxide hydrolase [Terriglobia bacterium]